MTTHRQVTGTLDLASPWAVLVLVLLLLVMLGCGKAEPRTASGVLSGKCIAILTDEGFQQSELVEPRRALEEAGAQTLVVSPHVGTVRGWSDGAWADPVRVDLTLMDARPTQFDALLLPGGVINADRLRMNPYAVAFVHSFASDHKPIAAICHGPWTLIEADGVKGRTLTSWPSLRTDLMNAGANWIDVAVFRDGSLVTSRKPEDLPHFIPAMISEFSGSLATNWR